MRIPNQYRPVILVIALLVMGFLYYLLVLSPAISKRKVLVERTEKRKGDLLQMLDLKHGWENFMKRREEAEKRLTAQGKSFTLLSFLERVSRSVGIEKKIQYMKPLTLHEEGDNLKPEGLEISLEGVTMKELVSFLYRIEYSGKLISIRRIKIQKIAQTQTLKATLQAHSYSRS